MMGTMEDDGTLFLYDFLTSPVPDFQYDEYLYGAFGEGLAEAIINSTLVCSPDGTTHTNLTLTTSLCSVPAEYL